MTPAMERNSNVDGPFEMVQKIYAEGGAGAFWSGAQERVLYWGPAVAIFLSAYCRVGKVFCSTSDGFYLIAPALRVAIY